MIALVFYVLVALAALAWFAILLFVTLAAWLVGLLVFAVQCAVERRKVRAVPRPKMPSSPARWSDRR